MEEKVKEKFKKYDTMLIGIYILFAMVAFIVIVDNERLNKIEDKTSINACEVSH